MSRSHPDTTSHQPSPVALMVARVAIEAGIHGISSSWCRSGGPERLVLGPFEHVKVDWLIGNVSLTRCQGTSVPLSSTCRAVFAPRSACIVTLYISKHV